MDFHLTILCQLVLALSVFVQDQVDRGVDVGQTVDQRAVEIAHNRASRIALGRRHKGTFRGTNVTRISTIFFGSSSQTIERSISGAGLIQSRQGHYTLDPCTTIAFPAAKPRPSILREQRWPPVPNPDLDQPKFEHRYRGSLEAAETGEEPVKGGPRG